MSTQQRQFIPKLKYYQIFIIACLLSPLLILNSNYINNQRAKDKFNKEKRNLFNKIISKRYLDEEAQQQDKTDIDKVCLRGSSDLQEYYKTGDFSKIGLDEKPITCEEKDAKHMKALKGLIKSLVGDEEDKRRNLEEGNNQSDEGSLKDNITDYAMHMLPIAVFLVIAIFCIPGWLICCCCNCCNCCCCCCCKKSGCVLPCFIFTYILYALSIVVCIYGLSQSNKIFNGLSDTECSFLRFIDEVLDGESKQSLPKWAGISEIVNMLQRIKTTLEDIKLNSLNEINTKIDNLDAEGGPKKSFLKKIEKANEKFYKADGTTYIDDYYKTYVENGAHPEYVLDIIAGMGKYDTETKKGVPENSVIYYWVYEYQEVANVADEKLESTKGDFNNILNENFETIDSVLEDGQNVVNDLKSNFDEIKDSITSPIIDYSELIDHYGKLGFKLVFSVLDIMNNALAVFILFIYLCSGKMCTNCVCCRCLFKFLTHLLWNILALLMIITFLVGFTFSFVGKVGSDVVSLISFIVSEDNIGEGKENILINQLGEAKDYIYTCINGNGDIINELGIDTSQLDSFDGIKQAENIIENVTTEFRQKKQMIVYNQTMEHFLDITKDLKTNDDFGYIIQKCDDCESKGVAPSAYLKFQEMLTDINSYSEVNKNEKWDSTCQKTTGCPDGTPCYNPLSCLPSQRSWSSSIPDEAIKRKIDIVKNIKESIDYANTETAENGGYKKKLEELRDSYDGFLEGYIGVLSPVNDTIKQITNIIKEYTGDEGGLFSFVNCNFIGSNLKVILKYLKTALGKKIYTVGICLIIVGISLALSISSTILLIVIINIQIDENKQKLNKPEIQELKKKKKGMQY